MLGAAENERQVEGIELIHDRPHNTHTDARHFQRTDLHPRLLNGSDYPLPAINVIIRTGELLELGYITEEERGYLNEIYDFNPLLFDFVVKRTVRGPNGERFAPEVFYAREFTAPAG